jgi:hypothetical protein
VAEARRDWDRTGIILDPGALYRLTYLGERWRDAEAAPCGPGGQEAAGMLDLRRWLTLGRRLRRQPWMRLVATVAYPRRWTLREKGLGELVTLLFHNDPPQLTRQLAAIGQDLTEPGASIFLRNEAQAGLLYLFANDWWQTASNNSGGVALQLLRTDEEANGVPLWILRAGGSWIRRVSVASITRSASSHPSESA